MRICPCSPKVEAADSNPDQCLFESNQGHQFSVVVVAQSVERRSVIPEAARSKLVYHPKGFLAQLEEHRIDIAKVVGSGPTGTTILISGY